MTVHNIYKVPAFIPAKSPGKRTAQFKPMTLNSSSKCIPVSIHCLSTGIYHSNGMLQSPKTLHCGTDISRGLFGAGPIAPTRARNELHRLRTSYPARFQCMDRLPLPSGVCLARRKTFQRLAVFLPRWCETWLLQAYTRNGH